MKGKIFTTLALATLAMGAMAQDKTYVVYSDAPLAAGQEALPNDYYIWEGTYTQTGTYGETPMEITLGNSGWAGGGWQTLASFDYTQISANDYDLVFVMKSTDNFTFKVQYKNMTTNQGKETPFAFTRDGEWQTVRINLKKNFPEVVAGIANGNQVYSPGIVFSDITPGQKISFKSVTLEPAKAPAPVEGGKTFYGQEALNPTATVSSILNYRFVTNADGTVTISWGYSNADKITGFVGNEIFINNAFPVGTEISEGDYTYSYTTGESYTAGEELKVTFRLKQAGPLVETPVTYIVGSENAKPAAAPIITASASDITSEGATIAYEVALPAELAAATVKVTANGNTVAESPFVLTGLEENTDYTYTLVAEATLDGKTYTSAPAEVKFRTLRKDAQDLVYSGNTSGTATHAMVGDNLFEDIPYTIDYTVTYTPEGKIKIDAKINSEREIIGLVPQLMINGPYVGNFSNVDGVYTFTTPESYEAGTLLNLNIFMAYAGGSVNNEFNYTAGQTGSTGVEGVEDEKGLVDVYTISGIRVAKNVEAPEALKGLNPGLYIVGGKKVIVK